MTPILLLIALLVLAFVPMGSCWIWGRIDAKPGRFRPLFASCITAMLHCVLLACFILAMLIVELRGQGQGMLLPDLAGVIIVLAIVYLYTGVFGYLGYRIGHHFNHRLFHLHQAVDDGLQDAANRIRVEETGNPYQPPTA